jgi:hypothetical protein
MTWQEPPQPMASMAQPDPHFEPPADLASRALPIETIAPGTALYRLHRSDLGALHFGKTGHNRFDDPQSIFGVCYLALSLEGAFAETCLRAVGATLLSYNFLAERSVTTLVAARTLRLVSLHGPGLAAVGATSIISSGIHATAQAWSRALHDHSDAPDGLSYRANHDNGEHCIALFEHTADALSETASDPLTADRKRLGVLLDRYKVALG